MFFALPPSPPAQSAPAAPTPTAEIPRDAVVGVAREVELARRDDALPLPIPALWAPGPHGDVLLSPPSGDPFFLGFAAGKHYPPADERIDPELARIAAALPRDGRPAPVTYAFVMFSKRMTAERVAALAAVGARVLEFHPFYTLKVALEPRSIEAAAGLDFVRWVGVERSWQKLHPDLAARLGGAQPAEPLAVYVNVFESDLCADSVEEVVAQAVESDPDGRTVAGDPAAAAKVTHSNGWQQRRLQQLGVEVGPWIESIKAFQARVPAAAFEQLVALDFVQFVDLDVAPTDDHDEGLPMSNADRVRATYDGAQSGNCQAGIIDSGLDTGHAAIDPWGVGWDYSGAGNPFDDTDGHGTHTGGTILGNADVDDSYQGGAPGLGLAQNRRFFVVRRGGGAPLATWLSVMDSSYFDGTYTSAAPMLVSNSYSANVSTGAFIGSESSPRTIDAQAFPHDQLWIWSASNEGPTSGTIGLESCAKNALTVGNVLDYREPAVGDPGTIWSGSSRGPCGDGRWKPNVSATGQVLSSCQAGTTTGYVTYGGTSMATPLVASLAAQLCDHYSWLRYNPSALSVALMAGALTKDDALLTSPAISAAHLNAYGVGRVDAYKANYGDSQQALYWWAFDQSWSGGYAELDFSVSAGATRVAVYFHYKEAACSSGASQALVNDVDMFLDAEPFTGAGSSGDYSAQQSNVDNTEVRILNSPTVGNWKVKLWPSAIAPFQTVHSAVAVVVTYGDTTPDTTLDLTATDYYVQPGDDVHVTAVYSNPSYVASAVFLDSTASGNALTASYNTMLDGSTADLTDNPSFGRDVTLGDVVHGTSRTHHWTTNWLTEGLKSFAVQARSDNALDETQSIGVFVDGTAPAAVTNLHSTTHTSGAWSNDPTISYAWTAATDNLSGVDGYGLFTTTAASLPGALKDIEEVTSYNETLGEGSWYFNVRSLDYCGNWDTQYASAGPFRIDTTAPATPTGLTSTTHTVGVQACSTSVSMHWNLFFDGGSGQAGFLGVWSASSSLNPTGAPNIAAGSTSYTADIGSSNLARWFHLRAKDNAGNYGATAHLGPFYANASSVSSYCTAKTNSLGCVPAVGSVNQPSLGAGNFTITCSNVLNQQNGLAIWGSAALASPFQGGTLCVQSPTIRTPLIGAGGSASGTDCTGGYAFTFDTAYMNVMGIAPGDTLYAQFWMRDPASPSTTGLSNALRFTACQ